MQIYGNWSICISMIFSGWSLKLMISQCTSHPKNGGWIYIIFAVLWLPPVCVASEFPVASDPSTSACVSWLAICVSSELSCGAYYFHFEKCVQTISSYLNLKSMTCIRNQWIWFDIIDFQRKDILGVAWGICDFCRSIIFPRNQHFVVQVIRWFYKHLIFVLENFENTS